MPKQGGSGGMHRDGQRKIKTNINRINLCFVCNCCNWLKLCKKTKDFPTIRKWKLFKYLTNFTKSYNTENLFNLYWIPILYTHTDFQYSQYTTSHLLQTMKKSTHVESVFTALSQIPINTPQLSTKNTFIQKYV